MALQYILGYNSKDTLAREFLGGLSLALFGARFHVDIQASYLVAVPYERLAPSPDCVAIE
jgi:hypothetical protein